jgi:hypothetical protein
MMNLHLLPLLASGLLLGADARTENQAQKDLDKFQGDWVLVSYTVDGKAATPDELKTMPEGWRRGRRAGILGR